MTVPCTARPCIHALILILIVLYRSGIHGRGLYCARNIAAGELVIEYSGVLIRSSLTDLREKYYDSKVWWHYTGRNGWSVGLGRSDWVVGWLVDGFVGIFWSTRYQFDILCRALVCPVDLGGRMVGRMIGRWICFNCFCQDHLWGIGLPVGLGRSGLCGWTIGWSMDWF